MSVLIGNVRLKSSLACTLCSYVWRPILPWYGIAQVYSYSVLIYIIIFFSKIEMIRSIIIYYWDRHCLGVRYRTPRLRGYGSGTGHRATPMRTVSGSSSLWNNYSARLGIRGCVSVPARICSNCYFTNKNSCWGLTLLRPSSLIICIYCHAIQTSISLYKRYKIFNGREWKKITRYRSNLSYFIPFIFIFLILIFSIRSWIKVINVMGNLLSHQWIGVGFDVL